MENTLEYPPVDKYIFLTDNREDTRLIRISDNKNFKWRKTPIPLNQIASHPYYTLLEVGNAKLTPVEWTFQEEEIKDDQQEVQERNNKDIFVIEEAQKLQIEEIQRKKKQMRPQELIGELVQNNQQFQKRTQYSKQKYLKKKQKKYMFQLHAEPTSLANIHQHYFNNQKDAIYSIRWDMLALMLLHSGPYKNVLLAEQTRGIALAGVLAKKHGNVTVVSGKSNTSIKNYQIVEQMNIEREVQERVQFVDWEGVKGLEQKQERYDNVILMGDYEFTSISTLIEPLLRQGAILTYFCHSLSPIEQVARFLKEKGYLNVKIFDSWCRQYQVLKNRTHPLMTMDSCSGYLLTAIAVIDK